MLSTNRKGLLFLRRIYFVRKHKVEYYSQEEYHSHAVFGKNSLHNLGEYVEHASALSETEAHAER